MSTAACAFCGKAVEPDRPGKGYREVVGWEAPRRDGGGLHALTGRTGTGRFACVVCVDLIRNGMNPGQTSML